MTPHEIAEKYVTYKPIGSYVSHPPSDFECRCHSQERRQQEIDRRNLEGAIWSFVEQRQREIADYIIRKYAVSGSPVISTTNILDIACDVGNFNREGNPAGPPL